MTWLSRVIPILLVAQTAHAAVTTESLDVGGTAQLYRTDSRLPRAVREAGRTALTDVMTAWGPQFDVSNLEVLLELSYARPPGGLFAVSGYVAVPGRPDQVGCVVTVYRAAETRSAAALKFTVAHELAHCYQFAIRSELRSTSGPRRATADPNAWWVEGSAEYLASTIYPPAGNPITRTIRDFDALTARTIFDEDYGQYWLFVFLSHARGAAAVLDMIRHVPIARADQLAYLERAPLGPSTNLFRDYAMATAKRQLPRQPRLAPSVRTVRAYPAIESLQANPLAIATYQINLPAPRRDHGLALRMRQGRDKAYRFSTPQGEISETELNTCGATAPRALIVVVGRGQDTDINAAAQLAIEEVPCRPPLTMASLEGTYEAYTSWPLTMLTEPQTFSDDRPPFAALDLGSKPNELTIATDGAISGQVTGTQHDPDQYVAFKGAQVASSFTLGEVIKENRSAIRVRVRFVRPLTGTGTGPGGKIVDNKGTVDMKTSLSLPLRFPPYDNLECYNMKIEAGKLRCGGVTFLQGERPRLGMGRTLD